MDITDCLKYADETKELIIKKDALAEIPGLLSGHFEFDSVCLIADENTFNAAGLKVKETLEKVGVKIAGVYIFPGLPRLHADYNHVRFLKEWISSRSGFPALVPIAVGSGTINDLVKRTSSEIKLPYLCVPTAASVDGYTPSGASLLMDGFKQTVPCTAPRAVSADPDIIALAPAYLASSGFGDLAGKITAGTDWIIADRAASLAAPGAQAIDPVAWAMVQNGLMDALGRSVDAAKGNSEAVKALFQALAITGFAVQHLKNTRPVSGAEHLYSHVWEMEDLSLNGVPVTHGHKVTIGTLATTAFTEIFFADPKGPPAWGKSRKHSSREERKAEVSAVFRESSLREAVIAAAMEKMMDEKTAEMINQAFMDCWKDIRDQVLERLLPYKELKALLARAECPIRPEAIGLSRNNAIAATRKAQMIRNRFNVLDLSWNMGNFDTILDKMDKSEIYLR